MWCLRTADNTRGEFEWCCCRRGPVLKDDALPITELKRRIGNCRIMMLDNAWNNPIMKAVWHDVTCINYIMMGAWMASQNSSYNLTFIIVKNIRFLCKRISVLKVINTLFMASKITHKSKKHGMVLYNTIPMVLYRNCLVGPSVSMFIVLQIRTNMERVFLFPILYFIEHRVWYDSVCLLLYGTIHRRHWW